MAARLRRLVTEECETEGVERDICYLGNVEDRG